MEADERVLMPAWPLSIMLDLLGSLVQDRDTGQVARADAVIC